MANLRCVLALVVLVGATHIKGDDAVVGNSTEAAPLNIYFPPLLIPITPIDVIIEPRFVIHHYPTIQQLPVAAAASKNPPPRSDKKGQLLSAADGCGFSALGNNRIVGGGPAKNGAWPWMALLAYKAPPHLAHLIATFNCGGSIITTRHILTAAHCVSPELWFARLGEHDVRTETDGPHEDVSIVSKKTHPQYNKDLLIYDVAVLTLQRDLTFNDRIRPICLPLDPPHSTKSFVGQNPFSTGWGITSEGGQQSPFLKQVQVPVVDTNVCREIFRRTGVLRSEKQISEMIVCAGIHAGQASCQGDSGGPLQLPVHENGKFPYYQIGVVSWGIPCAKPNIPTVYSSVQFFGKWIKSQLH